jgi:probable rRNA maturation factor
MPSLKLYNRQRKHKPSLPWLRRIIKAALPLCEAEARSSDAPLLNLDEIEFTIISDTEMSRVHAEFLNDPTPTDVITFHHGEILVSADTALRQGAEHGQSMDQELALYLIHGLMHLGGWEDHEESEAKEMTQKQESILSKVTAQML